MTTKDVVLDHNHHHLQSITQSVHSFSGKKLKSSRHQKNVKSLCILILYQNVSSAFAVFIREAKEDIRISQLNTHILLLIHRKRVSLRLGHLAALEHSVPFTTARPLRYPSPAGEGRRKTKNALHLQDTAYIKRFCLDQMRIENRINFRKRRSSFALARTKDVGALGHITFCRARSGRKYAVQNGTF